MSCDYCARSARRITGVVGLTAGQTTGVWAAAWTLLPRCPRGHWVSPVTMVCRPCNLRLGEPRSWPPTGIYTSMKHAIADLRAGILDQIIARHHPARQDVTILVGADGELVIVEPGSVGPSAEGIPAASPVPPAGVGAPGSTVLPVAPGQPAETIPADSHVSLVRRIADWFQERRKTGVRPEIQPTPGPEGVSTQAQAVKYFLGVQDVPMQTAGKAAPEDSDETFEITPQVQRLLQAIGAGLRYGYAQVRAGRETMLGRAFGLYGPPGTGKNTLARQIGAALRLPYEETSVDKDTDLQQLLGGVKLEADGKGGTRSVMGLGRIGKALVEGSVVCINEINLLPAEAQSRLYEIAQEGRFILPGPEGSEEVYHVHPSSILFLTWNPRGGDQDRPIEALETRLMSFRMDHPPEEQECGMLARWAEGTGLPVNKEKIEATIRMMRGLRALYDDGVLDEFPSYRHTQQFYALLQTTGDVGLAADRLRILTSQLRDQQQQWAEVEQLIRRFFPEYSDVV